MSNTNAGANTIGAATATSSHTPRSFRSWITSSSSSSLLSTKSTFSPIPHSTSYLHLPPSGSSSTSSSTISQQPDIV